MKIIKDFIVENLSFLLLIAFIIFFTQAELPYVIYTPGGSINLSERVKGDNLYKEKGSFSMTYVSMAKGSPMFLLSSFIIPNWDIVKISNITYEGEDLWETIESDKIYLKEARSNAEYVAYTNAQIPFSIKKTKILVTLVDPKAKTKLKTNDEIISIDGYKLGDVSEFQKYLSSKKPGEKIIVEYKRDKDIKEDNVELINVNGESKIGIGIAVVNEYETPYNIDIEAKDNEAGPSGGFLSALSIYNRVTKEDITKGRTIMGTGTISQDGTVGEIGGVKYKILGAAKHNADIFICPKENEKEALKTVKDNKLKIKVIGVSTFKEALEELSKA